MLDVHVFRQLWEQAAQRAADQGRQLLLVVDGLDEDLRPGGHSVTGWLPGPLAGLPARVMVASRLYPQLPSDVDPAHPLAALVPGKLYMLPDSTHAARLRELAGQEITQLLRRADDDLALDVLGLLTAASGGPLTAADLAALTGSRPWEVHAVLDGDAARTLQQAGLTDAPRRRHTVNAQNSFPSGSASTCQPMSPPGSRRTAAPAPASGATVGTVTSQSMRFLAVFGWVTGR